jgi:hypothetical protein
VACDLLRIAAAAPKLVFWRKSCLSFPHSSTETMDNDTSYEIFTSAPDDDEERD